MRPTSASIMYRALLRWKLGSMSLGRQRKSSAHSSPIRLGPALLARQDRTSEARPDIHPRSAFLVPGLAERSQAGMAFRETSLGRQRLTRRRLDAERVEDLRNGDEAPTPEIVHADGRHDQRGELFTLEQETVADEEVTIGPAVQRRNVTEVKRFQSRISFR